MLHRIGLCGVMSSSLLILMNISKIIILKNRFFSNNMKTVIDRHMITIKVEYKHEVSRHFESIFRSVAITVDELLIFSEISPPSQFLDSSKAPSIWVFEPK